MRTLTLPAPVAVRWSFVITTALVLSGIVAFLAFHINYHQDDAYIFYRYADNIISGNGWVFNPGEMINATTSTLYPLLLAGLGLVMPFPAAGFLISAISLSVALLLIADLLRSNGMTRAAIRFPLLFLANPLAHAGMGMETFLTLALLMAALKLYLNNRLHWSALVMGLAVLSRPDAVLFAAVLFADYVIRTRRLPVVAGLIFVLPVIPWLIFAQLYFGSVLPSTLFAKTVQTGMGFWGHGLLFLQGIQSMISPLWFLPTVAAVYYLAVNRSWLSCRLIRLILAWAVLYVFAYGIVLNPPAYPWYYAPLIVGWALILSLALSKVKHLHLLALLVLLITYQAVSVSLSPYTSSARAEVYREAALWLNDHASEGDTVAAVEIGALGYYYQRGKIIDSLGLVTPDVVQSLARGDNNWFIHHYQPDYIITQTGGGIENYVNEQWFNDLYSIQVAIGNDAFHITIYAVSAIVPQNSISPITKWFDLSEPLSSGLPEFSPV
jgi:arabinofuranosyltransferase